MSYAQQLHKQADKVEKKMADLGQDMRLEVERQKAMLPKLEKRLDKVNSDIRALETRLKNKADKNGNFDFEKFNDREGMTQRNTYMTLIYERDELNNTIMMVEESIAEAETLYVDGLPTDQSAMGPRSTK